MTWNTKKVVIQVDILCMWKRGGRGYLKGLGMRPILPSTVTYSITTKEENVAIFRRYIAEISCIEGYRQDISWKNIGPTIFREKSWEIGDISRYIGDFSRYIAWSTKSNALQWKSNVLQCPLATMHLLLEIASEGIWTPNQKVWGSLHLPSGLTRPCNIKCTKHIYT